MAERPRYCNTCIHFIYYYINRIVHIHSVSLFGLAFPFLFPILRRVCVCVCVRRAHHSHATKLQNMVYLFFIFILLVFCFSLVYFFFFFLADQYLLTCSNSIVKYVYLSVDIKLPYIIYTICVSRFCEGFCL